MNTNNLYVQRNWVPSATLIVHDEEGTLDKRFFEIKEAVSKGYAVISPSADGKENYNVIIGEDTSVIINNNIYEALTEQGYPAKTGETAGSLVDELATELSVTSADVGKVVGVDEDGNIALIEGGGGGSGAGMMVLEFTYTEDIEGSVYEADVTKDEFIDNFYNYTHIMIHEEGEPDYMRVIDSRVIRNNSSYNMQTPISTFLTGSNDTLGASWYEIGVSATNKITAQPQEFYLVISNE